MIEFDLRMFFYGLVLALPFAIINFILVVRAMLPRQGETPLAAYNRLMARIMLKMGISLAVLFLAALQGAGFVLGALTGLLLQFGLYPFAVKYFKGKGVR